MAFFAHFDLDLVSALGGQLVEAFAKLDAGSFTVEHITQVPPERGVYQLLRNDTLVYVGKANKLPNRLTQHHRKITGRQNVNVSEMTFKCLSLPKNWIPLTHEETLIEYYKSQGGICEWNGIGFGPNDPGKERDTTNKPPEGFDSKFPIREDWPCTTIKAGDWNVNKLLIEMKDKLPYLLRYDKKHHDYKKLRVRVPKDGMSAIELMTLITKTLPGWQSTRFVSHMILYKGEREYPQGNVIWRQPVKA